MCCIAEPSLQHQVTFCNLSQQHRAFSVLVSRVLPVQSNLLKAVFQWGRGKIHRDLPTLTFSSFPLVIIPCTNSSLLLCGSLEHLAYSLPEDVFPATATLLVPSPSTAMETGSAIASLEWQGRSVTAVHMGFTTSKKEAVLVCRSFAPKHRLILYLFIYLFLRF